MEQTVALNDADENRICDLLKSFASKHLTSDEISSGLADVRKDEHHGNRIIFTAGQNPHYAASLWRSDELDDNTE